MKTVKATFVRNHIAEIWDMARKEPISVETRGQAEFVIISASEYKKLTGERKARQAGYARHLFEGIDVDQLLATPIPGIEEYMP
jgi:PHD/YefM family antitoxin component YafN of YafNO toxin-antitoxin module